MNFCVCYVTFIGGGKEERGNQLCYSELGGGGVQNNERLRWVIGIWPLCVVGKAADG